MFSHKIERMEEDGIRRKWLAIKCSTQGDPVNLTRTGQKEIIGNYPKTGRR